MSNLQVHDHPELNHRRPGACSHAGVSRGVATVQPPLLRITTRATALSTMPYANSTRRLPQPSVVPLKPNPGRTGMRPTVQS